METDKQQSADITTSQVHSAPSLTGRAGSGSAIDDFLKQLRERVVHFTYRKKDGTLRDAYGTTCLENIPSECWPKGTAKGKMPEYIVNYFDIQRNDWRCFNKNYFIGFEDIGSLTP